jgi:hypothetical protein
VKGPSSATIQQDEAKASPIDPACQAEAPTEAQQREAQSLAHPEDQTEAFQVLRSLARGKTGALFR